MKKTISRIGAAILASVIAVSLPLSASADDQSYTYNYDYWGEVQDCPDCYTVSGVFTSVDMNVDVNFRNPQSLMVRNDFIYVADTGNNRIVELKRTGNSTIEFVRSIDSIKAPDGIKSTFNEPCDVAIDDDGNFYVCDKSNNRVVKFDKDLNFILEFLKPTDKSLDEKLSFLPTRIVIDSAGRVYCIADLINKGYIKYENNGEFSGFVGSTPVDFDFLLYLKKKFASEEARAKIVSFVPTEYSNLYMDKEGFIYGVIGTAEAEKLKSGKADSIRKINLLGSDILVRNGTWPVYGDIYMGGFSSTYSGASKFIDVTVMADDVYVCLDSRRGRLFGYDDQGNLLYAFGGSGNMDGYFKSPISLEHMGTDLLVLDNLHCSITLFTPTEFGKAIYDAIDKFDNGDYTGSEAAWRRVLALDGNFDRAYIGIGRSLLRQEKYKDSLEYFKVKYDAENYSKAYKMYRKEWVQANIGKIVFFILVLVFIPLGFGKYKALKYEIELSELFMNDK